MLMMSNISRNTIFLYLTRQFLLHRVLTNKIVLCSFKKSFFTIMCHYKENIKLWIKVINRKKIIDQTKFTNEF